MKAQETVCDLQNRQTPPGLLSLREPVFMSTNHQLAVSLGPNTPL